MNRLLSRVAPGCWAAPLAAAAISLVAIGCQSLDAMPGPWVSPAQSSDPAQPAATPADADRAALARFVGVWHFDGWSTDRDGSRRMSSGVAAGSIENRYFVLLDIQASDGQLSSRLAHKSGSMMFACEPGKGPTLTAWGDASPSIRHLAGKMSKNRTAIAFEEPRAPEGHHRIWLSVTFENENRWTAEVRDSASPDWPPVATYTFTRS